MYQLRLFRQNEPAGRLVPLILFAVITVLLVSGCSTAGGRQESGNPLPTPRPAEDVGAAAQAAAKAPPETTWDNYVRDIIAEQVKQRESLISLRERYENPSITVQNLAGMVKDIDLVEDRTQFDIKDNSASTYTDFDVRLTFANGDTDTRTCRFNVTMEYVEEENVWYVLNPAPLAVFSVCGQ